MQVASTDLVVRPTRKQGATRYMVRHNGRLLRVYYLGFYYVNTKAGILEISFH